MRIEVSEEKQTWLKCNLLLIKLQVEALRIESLYPGTHREAEGVGFWEKEANSKLQVLLIEQLLNPI